MKLDLGSIDMILAAIVVELIVAAVIAIFKYGINGIKKIGYKDDFSRKRNPFSTVALIVLILLILFSVGYFLYKKSALTVDEEPADPNNSGQTTATTPSSTTNSKTTSYNTNSSGSAKKGSVAKKPTVQSGQEPQTSTETPDDDVMQTVRQHKKYSEGKYEGYIVNYMRQGQGVFIWNNGNRYEGEWRNDKRNGHGTYTSVNGDKYVGNWVNDKINGEGTYWWADGASYTGAWVNEVFNGTGTYKWSNGNTYTGEWRNGKQHGRGVSTDKKGKTITQIWENGVAKEEIKTPS